MMKHIHSETVSYPYPMTGPLLCNELADALAAAQKLELEATWLRRRLSELSHRPAPVTLQNPEAESILNALDACHNALIECEKACAPYVSDPNDFPADPAHPGCADTERNSALGL